MTPSGNKSFTAQDIERYHSCNMSEAERHALEKAALDDPFLADALEGFAYTQTASSDLQSLRERIREKTTGNKRAVPFIPQWLRVAAVALVVAGSGWLAYRAFTPAGKELAIDKNTETNNRVTTEQPLHQNNNRLEESKAVDADTVRITSTNPKKQQQRKAQQKSNPMVTAAPEQTVAAEVRPIMDQVLKDSQPATAYRSNAVDLSIEANRNGYNNRALPSPDNTRRNMSPLPEFHERARVQQDIVVRGTNRLDPQDTNQVMLRGKASGVDTITNLNVVLKPAEVTMNEVVINSKKNPARRSFFSPDSTNMPVPEDGYDSFDDYVTNNIRSTEDLKINPVSGVVELSFDVDRNGKPVNITITKSLCEKCDLEAVRLLKDGPKWKKKKNKNMKGRVSIKF